MGDRTSRIDTSAPHDEARDRALADAKLRSQLYLSRSVPVSLPKSHHLGITQAHRHGPILASDASLPARPAIGI